MALLVVAALAVSACGAPAPQSAVPTTAAPVVATAAATAPAAATLAPTAAPTAAATTAPTAAATTAATSAPTAAASPTTSAATPAPAAAPFNQALATTLQQILDETTADGSIPGAVLAVHVPGQQPWVGASGVADRQSGAAMTTDTRVRIASISKVFTAALVLLLVEEGTISLDAPVATYLPDVIPNGQAVTVRQLLQHTSGIYDYLEDRNVVNQAYREPQRTWQPAELVAYANQFPASFAPGSPGNWDYSSTNYVLLGMIVEQVTGNSMAQAMRQRIFEPLELDNTFFVPQEEVQGEQARGYSRTVDQTNISLSFAFGTANMVSTVGDVQRFGDALFGGRLLRPETLNQMLQFTSGKGQYNMPALEYGLGVMRNVLPIGPGPGGQQRPPELSTVLGHIGGFGGFRSALWHAPEGGITIALGMNQASTDPNLLATRVWQAIVAAQGE
jgi:D-alanyl-D-alanine carboxypeptidase